MRISVLGLAVPEILAVKKCQTFETYCILLDLFVPYCPKQCVNRA